MKKVKQAVIVAGGLGTRLRPFTYDLPKPMYPVQNVPFIEKLVLQIKGFGISNILILLGYLPDKIIEYLGDGSQYGLNINYDISPVSFESGERLRHAFDLLEDDFLFMYCDNYCPICYSKLVDDYFSNKSVVQLSVYDNGDKYTKSNLFLNENGKISVYDKSRTNSCLNGVDIGYMIVNKLVVNFFDEYHIKFSDIFSLLIEDSSLYGTLTYHRYYSIGSFDRMELTQEFFLNKKVVFLDRDGTLNVKPEKACYIEDKKDFVWLPGAIDALRLLKENGYILVIVTNQPGIARGNLTHKKLDEIHEKMQSDLKLYNVSIDYIYSCNHNWNDGCWCRKPNPGLIYQAQKDLSIDLTRCVLFGDDERDIMAAESAGLKKSYLISEHYSLFDAVKDYLKEDKNDCF